VPSFPKDILFSGGELTSEDALNSLLWETCAPARIASRTGSSSFDATPFPRLLIRPFVPAFVSPSGSFCAPLHYGKDSSACSEAETRRAEKKKGGSDDETRFLPRKKRDDARCRCQTSQRACFQFSAIHISRHESVDRYRRGPLRKTDSSRFDSRRAFADRPSVLFIAVIYDWRLSMNGWIYCP